MRNTELLGLQHQSGSCGVIDHVQNAVERGKARQIDGAFAVIRIHAKRRCVDQQLRVQMPVQILVVVFAGARNDDDRVCAEAFQNVAHGHRCAAGADGVYSARLHGHHAAFLKQPRKAERVGVVAGEFAAAVYNRVDASDGSGFRGYLVEICHDGLFVGNRDVQPVKRAGFQKRLQFFRLFFIEFVFIAGQFPVNLRGIAVTELPAEQSAAQHPRSPRCSFRDTRTARRCREALP